MVAVFGPCLYKSSLNIIYRALNVAVKKSDHFTFPHMETLLALLPSASIKTNTRGYVNGDMIGVPQQCRCTKKTESSYSIVPSSNKIVAIC